MKYIIKFLFYFSEVNYDKNFQAFVNYALPKALGKAQKVVDTAKTFLQTLDEKTLNVSTSDWIDLKFIVLYCNVQ